MYGTLNVREFIYRIRMSMTSVSLASIIKLSVSMELSFLIFTFLKARYENKVQVKVTGSRRLENGLVVPGAFLARTTSRAIATKFEDYSFEGIMFSHGHNS